jgi:hypothetical protein
MIPKGPLGMFGIAQSQLERIGYNPLEASNPLGEPMSGGGGGGGFGFSLGGQRGPNQMEQTIDAHNYPGGFKVATDQYAARYSDQLDEAALLELKDKYPQGPASGGTWDDFAAQRQSNINNYYKTGELWGPKGLTGNKANDAAKVKSVINSKGGYTGTAKPATVKKYTGGPLAYSNPASRDRSGLVSRNPVRRISTNTARGVSPGGGNSRRTGRIGGRYGL